jgi:hypothetical protein
VPEEAPMIEKGEKRGFAAMITIGIGERNQPGSYFYGYWSLHPQGFNQIITRLFAYKAEQ